MPDHPDDDLDSGRMPLMDHLLVEWLATLPSDFKIRAGQGKVIFKQAYEPLLPRDVLYRPKMGFSVPLTAWLRGPLKDRVRLALLGERMRDCGYFSPVTLRRLVDEHNSGMRDHATALWMLLMFEAFLRLNEGAAPHG